MSPNIPNQSPCVNVCGTVVRWESVCWCLVYEAEVGVRDSRCLGKGRPTQRWLDGEPLVRKRNGETMDQSRKGNLEYVLSKNTYTANSMDSKYIWPKPHMHLTTWHGNTYGQSSGERRTEVRAQAHNCRLYVGSAGKNVYSVEEEIKQDWAWTLEMCTNVLKSKPERKNYKHKSVRSREKNVSTL